MATIDELEREEAAMADSEAAALRVLLDGMRELAVQLPDGSRLARQLADSARRLEVWAASPKDAGRWGGSAVQHLTWEITGEAAN